jgi:hypothetical protein
MRPLAQITFILATLILCVAAHAAPSKKKDKFRYFCGDFAKGKYVVAIPAYGEITTYSIKGEILDMQDALSTRRKTTVVPTGPSSGGQVTTTTFVQSGEDEEGGAEVEVAQLLENSDRVVFRWTAEPGKYLVCGKYPNN